MYLDKHCFKLISHTIDLLLHNLFYWLRHHFDTCFSNQDYVLLLFLSETGLMCSRTIYFYSLPWILNQNHNIKKKFFHHSSQAWRVLFCYHIDVVERYVKWYLWSRFIHSNGSWWSIEILGRLLGTWKILWANDLAVYIIKFFLCKMKEIKSY
jgi:hypothetical protein